MQILYYSALDTQAIPDLVKLIGYLRKDEFHSAATRLSPMH